MQTEITNKLFYKQLSVIESILRKAVFFSFDNPIIVLYGGVKYTSGEIYDIIEEIEATRIYNGNLVRVMKKPAFYEGPDFASKKAYVYF